ncbi:MAG: hypothetical protein QOK24_2049 [Verrucomicrobiota bacterium]
MPAPPTGLNPTRAQTVIIGLTAIVLAIGGFEAGRRTVDAAAVAKIAATKPSQPDSDVSRERKMLVEREHDRIRLDDIATVPFSELYDVLKSASREQLLVWARDLESMPRGPRQRAAVTAYYKSLIQVDHRAAIDAVLHAKNLLARDAAIDAMMKAAPESIWADLAEMTAELPYPGRGYAQDNLIPNWSRVDPVAASQFVEKHQFSPGVKLPGDESDRVVSLLSNWGEIDPAAARKWLEEDASRQTADAFRAFLTSWGRVDHAAAIDYTIANQQRPNFEAATNELVYEFVRSAKEDASRLLLLLPPEAAKAALKKVADVTNPHEIDPNIDRPPNYQRPAEEVARWMVTLPVELWKESIGRVAEGWLKDAPDSAKAWLAQLQPELRDVTVVSMFREAKAFQVASQQVIEVGLKISDPKLRSTTLAEYLRLLGRTTAEALQALDEFSIPAEQKAYLRRILRENENVR